MLRQVLNTHIMFSIPEAWVWDFWTADDGEQFHLFFLFASKALHDPERRHYRAAVGHAVSDDLRTWRRVEDALVHADPQAFDELAIWTGSVAQLDDGSWITAYTGAQLVDGKNRQTLGLARSSDLMRWDKMPGPIAVAEPEWYETLADDNWGDEAFRDPWIVRDPNGDGWHLLVTARANHGEKYDRAVVGHVWSSDLEHWEVRPPLSEPRHGFGQMEVMQSVEVGGQWFLVFDCFSGEMAESRRATGTTGGVWAARGEGPLGPWDFDDAQQLTDMTHYVGKVVFDRAGEPQFLAFQNIREGAFVGGVTDPVPVKVVDGRLAMVTDDPGFLSRV